MRNTSPSGLAPSDVKRFSTTRCMTASLGDASVVGHARKVDEPESTGRRDFVAANSVGDREDEGLASRVVVSSGKFRARALVPRRRVVRHAEIARQHCSSLTRWCVRISILLLSLIVVVLLLRKTSTVPLDELGTDSFPVGRQSIAYIKVPKTGSSTFAGVMRRVASHYGYAHALDGPEWTSTDCYTRGIFKIIPWMMSKRMALWSNHGTRRQVAGCLKKRMPNAFFVTSVREPTSRSMSQFYFKHVKRRGEEPTLANKLAWLKFDKDASPHYIYDYIRPSDEEWSPKRVLESYGMVLVMERAAESLLVLASLLGASIVDVLYTVSKNSTLNQRTDATHIPLENEPRKVRELVEVMYGNCKDADLYRIANEMLDKKLSNFGDKLESNLKRLNLMLSSVQKHCALGKVDCLWGDNGCNQKCIDQLAQERGWH